MGSCYFFFFRNGVRVEAVVIWVIYWYICLSVLFCNLKIRDKIRQYLSSGYFYVLEICHVFSIYFLPNSLNSTVGVMLLLDPFYKWYKWNLEWLNQCHRARQQWNSNSGKLTTYLKYNHFIILPNVNGQEKGNHILIQGNSYTGKSSSYTRKKHTYCYSFK